MLFGDLKVGTPLVSVAFSIKNDSARPVGTKLFLEMRRGRIAALGSMASHFKEFMTPFAFPFAWRLPLQSHQDVGGKKLAIRAHSDCCCPVANGQAAYSRIYRISSFAILTFQAPACLGRSTTLAIARSTPPSSRRRKRAGRLSASRRAAGVLARVRFIYFFCL